MNNAVATQMVRRRHTIRRRHRRGRHGWFAAATRFAIATIAAAGGIFRSKSAGDFVVSQNVVIFGA